MTHDYYSLWRCGFLWSRSQKCVWLWCRSRSFWCEGMLKFEGSQKSFQGAKKFEKGGFGRSEYCGIMFRKQKRNKSISKIWVLSTFFRIGRTVRQPKTLAITLRALMNISLVRQSVKRRLLTESVSSPYVWMDNTLPYATCSVCFMLLIHFHHWVILTKK